MLQFTLKLSKKGQKIGKKCQIRGADCEHSHSTVKICNKEVGAFLLFFASRIMQRSHSILIILALTTSLFVGSVHAQENEKKAEKPKAKFAGVKTKRTKTLGQVYSRRIKPLNEKVSKANDKEQELTNEESEKLLDEAFAGYLKLDKPDKWASHEYAHLYNTIGYFYYQKENTDKSLEYYIKASEEADISKSLYLNIVRTVGQLYISKEQYQNGIDYLEIWRKLKLEEAATIPASFLAILARLYYTVNNTKQSIIDIELAIEQTERNETSGIARESWYNLQRANYYNKKDFKKVKQIIEKLIVHFGKPKYWVELGGIFSELEKDEKIHQTYYIANLVKGLTNQSRKTALAYMNISAGASCPAAKVIEDGLKQKLIKPDLKIYQTLSSSYQQCFQYKDAIAALKKAIEFDETGETYSRLSGLYNLRGQIDLSIEAGEKSLKVAKLKNSTFVVLTLVGSYTATRQYDKALSTLKNLKDKKYQRQVSTWQKYIKNESAKFNSFAELGIDMDSIYEVTDKLERDFLKLYR